MDFYAAQHMIVNASVLGCSLSSSPIGNISIANGSLTVTHHGAFTPQLDSTGCFSVPNVLQVPTVSMNICF